MPDFTDRNGDTHTMAAYSGNSFRVAVTNRALRTHDFVWKPFGEDGWLPEFTCYFCKHPCYYNGVEGDHNIMQSHDGSHALWNLNLSCSTCNKGWKARMGAPAMNTRSRHKHAHDDQIGH